MATEILNERLLYPSYEIIGGEKFMSPAANLTHSGIIGRLYVVLFNHLEFHKSGYVFTDDVDVHFSNGSMYKPDLVVILKENEEILNWSSNIYGAPDMVVEVLSKSTRRNDLTIKKDTYEANGVREYWIVDPWMKSIDVYLLRDGKYFFDDEYILFDKEEFEQLNETEKTTVKYEIPVKILDGLTIRLDYIFKWGYK